MTRLGRPSRWRRAFRHWLAASEPAPKPLPCWSDSPTPDVAVSAAIVAICCSGGGIRSASFSMGALQALSARGIYQRASVVTAVSGGSYIAGAFATVSAGPTVPGDRAEVQRPQPPDFAFRHGAPEEQHVRTHAHYLFPGLAVSARGVINALYGLTANLALLLIFVFVPFRPSAG